MALFKPSSGPHFFLCLLFLASLSACTQHMGFEGRLSPFSKSHFFPDQGSARVPVLGTIPQGVPIGDSPLLTGYENGIPVQNIPMPITSSLLNRGAERYQIYCSPCHGYSGHGDGMIVQRGFLAPPSYFQERLLNAPAGHFFNVITHGQGAMYSYADRVDVRDRWAIIAYIRALQISQHSLMSSLSPEQRQKVLESNPIATPRADNLPGRPE